MVRKLSVFAGVGFLVLLLACQQTVKAAPATSKVTPVAKTSPKPFKKESEEDYYKLLTFTPPKEITPAVSGMINLSQNRIMFCNRYGGIYIIEKPYGDPKKAVFKKWAFGLSQPLGLLEKEGWIYTAQRGEITRIKDTSGDGRADLFETVTDDWEISGAYHEYNFGPRLDKEGKFWVTTNKPFGSEPYGKVSWRGWALKYDAATGKKETVACGLRSPAGIEFSPEGEAFYTDNQGEWCNASKLSHIGQGDWHGHIEGTESTKLPESTVPYPGEIKDGFYMKDLKEKYPTFKMPSVWFPYDKMGRSPCGFKWDLSGGKFGPFQGQVFVGDQYSAIVMRVFLEKVEGHWQGAVFRFREGLQSGVIRVLFGADNSLFLGLSNAGWGGKGRSPHGLQRLVWTGKVPFEIKEMKARPDGFDLLFTKEVDVTLAKEIANYKIKSYTYRLRKAYGGPEEDNKELKIDSVKISKDNKTVSLKVEGLRAGYVHELDVQGVRASTGQQLLHTKACYTLVNIPKK